MRACFSVVTSPERERTSTVCAGPLAGEEDPRGRLLGPSFKSKGIFAVTLHLTLCQPDTTLPCLRRVLLNSPPQAALTASRPLYPDFQFPPSGPGLALLQTPRFQMYWREWCALGKAGGVSAAPKSLVHRFLVPRGLVAGLASLGWKH